jgi:hypothetical protein
MRQRPTLIRLAADLLLANRGRRFTARELAEALLAANPGHFAAKREAYEAKNPGKSVAYQLEREIYARRHAIVEADPAIETDASDRMLFFAEPALAAGAPLPDGPSLPAAFDPGRAPHGAEREGEGVAERLEAELYPLLQTFLRERENVVTKRIREQTSSNRRGRNGNKWLHPDVVGMHALGRDWLEVVRRCSMELPTRKAKLVAVEVKWTLSAGDVRQHFFQTVSNSTWANQAYLAACEIRGEDTWRELETLCAAHGVGYIRLYPEDPDGSRILIPAREREEIDWASANRIAAENADFRDYLQNVLNYLQTGVLMERLWNGPAGSSKAVSGR